MTGQAGATAGPNPGKHRLTRTGQRAAIEARRYAEQQRLAAAAPLLRAGICSRGHSIHTPEDLELGADAIRCARCVDDADALADEIEIRRVAALSAPLPFEHVPAVI